MKYSHLWTKPKKVLVTANGERGKKVSEEGSYKLV